MQKKAQAAMEFLMTYGWAILVVLLAIAALAYFGVLTPDRFLPASCVFTQPGLSCEDFKVDSDGTVTLVVRNGMGRDLRNVSISISGDCAGNLDDLGTLANGQRSDPYVIPCADMPDAGSRFSGDIEFAYTSDAGIDHTITGGITTRVQ